jgi:hypothetical protein
MIIIKQMDCLKKNNVCLFFLLDPQVATPYNVIKLRANHLERMGRKATGLNLYNIKIIRVQIEVGKNKKILNRLFYKKDVKNKNITS